MPTLAANNNTAFGGSLINQKYSPLADITILEADQAYYTGLFNRRIKKLSDANLFPRKLSLFTAAAWPVVAAATPPPMVVISSNRALWLSKLFKNADSKNRDAAFTGYNDPKTFDFEGVPWYSPLRSGRPVYIVVHYTEYTYYKQLLGGFRNVYVVGWRIPFRKGGYAPTGFGASRFAALELVKKLGYTKAWGVDDNVVNINGFPNTLAEVEAEMTADTAGIGFAAATENTGLIPLYREATFVEKAYDFDSQEAGLLQQVVLWNLTFLKSKNLTMSPYFVTSNEDVSLTNCLQSFAYAEKVIKPLKIIKLAPETDDKELNKGAAQLAKMRNELLTLLYDAEKDTQIVKGSTAAVKLSKFVTDTILPKSQNREGDPQVTQSMAIEQILALATNNRHWAPTKIFNPYDGFEGTSVELQSGAI